MRRLSHSQRVQIIGALVEGASVNATARQTGVSKVTILKLLADLGEVCLAYQQQILVRLHCKRIQCDEIWSFIQAKQKNVPRDQQGRGRGDCWIWVAMDADTKLIPCWHVGARDARAAHLFLEDLASRFVDRHQLTTDALRIYIRAVEDVFGWNQIDYAMLQKIYGAPIDEPHRYSPPDVVGIEKRWVMGNPDPDHISTSYVERQNLTMRMNMRRLTRLTNGHSKKLENHVHAVALHYMYYNFCRKHETLTKAAGGIRTTPAMAAGKADHAWKLSEVVALLEARERSAEPGTS